MGKDFDKIQPGWLVPKVVKESFDQFCVKLGQVAQEDCSGALFLWQSMPSQVREWAKLEAKNEQNLGKDFWLRFQKMVAGLIPMLLETVELQKEKKPAKSA